ncbi:RNA polymerase sigma factor SigX [Peribacillus cavernae]|uniref:RNA polymerase sigma factor n=1 Tax=Peribacillus cavernae TaxID=1674310 RepID=A0A433HM30_9BACI|nr:RNA polymerase sigma factor SigX [Peribacillus cavernae]MDQ0219029.1 RNA polymerase sigma-70 factor (ECF subfamily) [Peribacillus cavernae]RUQ29265.1 RNA polymerase sigma factor SigX [Peribacillus cavernae]
MDSVFLEIYEKYHRDLFQFLFYLVKNRETAEDLVQEVYIRVLKSYDRFEGKSSEKTWLFSIARNAAIDHFRKQRSWKQKLFESFDWERNQIKDQQPLPEEKALQNDNMRRVYKSLDDCTMDQRSVIILRYIQSLSISETAEVLGWTESKVKTTQHRALKAVKKAMEEQAGKEEIPFEKIPME